MVWCQLQIISISFCDRAHQIALFNLIPNMDHMPSKVWDEIAYPFPNITSCTVEVWECISKFIPQVFYNWCNSLYTCMQGLQLIHVNERGHQRAVCCGTLVGWVSIKRATTYRPYRHICIAEITITQIPLPQHPHTPTYSHSCVRIYKVKKTLFEIVSWQQKTETFSYGNM